jgi:hypothetical protein
MSVLSFIGTILKLVKVTLDHLFQPGNTEGKGRPPGIPNRRSRELEQRLKDRGDTDPADFLSSIVTNQTEPTELRIAASNYLLPYLYSKRGAMPPSRYVELQIDVPEFTNVSVAEEFLARILSLVARGHLDIGQGQELAALAKMYIDSQYARDELQFKLNPPETRDTTIHITGGLDPLPGTDISMPQLNGHVADARALAAPNDVVPSTNQVPEATANELSPGQLKAQGPHPLQERHFRTEEPGKNSSNGGQEP